MARLDWSTVTGGMNRSRGVRADLRGADLRDADLSGAGLSGAVLRGANLRDAVFSVSVILRAFWGSLSETLTLELMRHDAESCGTAAMTAWAVGGECPMQRILRDFSFREDRKLWKPGKPKLRGIKLLEALAKEKGIKLS